MFTFISSIVSKLLLLCNEKVVSAFPRTMGLLIDTYDGEPSYNELILLFTSFIPTCVSLKSKFVTLGHLVRSSIPVSCALHPANDSVCNFGSSSKTSVFVEESYVPNEELVGTTFIQLVNISPVIFGKYFIRGYPFVVNTVPT